MRRKLANYDTTGWRGTAKVFLFLSWRRISQWPLHICDVVQKINFDFCVSFPLNSGTHSKCRMSWGHLHRNQPIGCYWLSKIKIFKVNAPSIMFPLKFTGPVGLTTKQLSMRTSCERIHLARALRAAAGSTFCRMSGSIVAYNLGGGNNISPVPSQSVSLSPRWR